MHAIVNGNLQTHGMIKIYGLSKTVISQLTMEVTLSVWLYIVICSYVYMQTFEVAVDLLDDIGSWLLLWWLWMPSISFCSYMHVYIATGDMSAAPLT